VSVLGVALPLDGWLALAALAVLAGGFLRGYTGFGSALAIIPPLTLVFGPKAAVAMHAVMEIPVILHLARDAIGKSERATIAPMLIVLVLTTPIGAIALKTVDPDAMRLVISVLVLGMVVLLAGRDRLPALAGRRAPWAAGAAGGLIQGASGVGGPPVVLALLARGDSAEVARANVVAVMSSLVGVSIVTFALYGLIDRQVLVIGLLAGPLCLAATVAGGVAFRRTGGRDYRSFALVVIAFSALLAASGAVRNLIP